jgi:hypothetical protein
MNIDYKKIIFNENYIIFIIKAAVVAALINIFMLVYFIIALNSFEYKLNNKYSYEVIKYYFKGIVTNPAAFDKSADMYKSLGRSKKELEDLQFALVLYLNMPHKDNAKIENIKQRIKILELEEKIDN